jgi:hypothetical protein
MGNKNSKNERKIEKLFDELINELSLYSSNFMIKTEAMLLLDKFQEGNLVTKDFDKIVSLLSSYPPNHLSPENIIRSREIVKEIRKLIF